MIAIEDSWIASALLRCRVKKNPVLSLLNLIRIKLSVSGKRDRLFLNLIKSIRGPIKILDIGCGGGREYLTKYGAEVYGVDVNSELLEIAGRIYKEVHLCDCIKLPFSSEFFDIVVSSDLFGHISDEKKIEMLKEVYRVLKPGGVTAHCIETMFDNYWTEILKRFCRVFKTKLIDNPNHIGLMYPSDLFVLFTDSGFRITKFDKTTSNINECGLLSYVFSEARLSGVFKFVVLLDKLLSSNILTRELTNIIIAPLVYFDNKFSSLNSGTGILCIAKKL